MVGVMKTAIKLDDSYVQKEIELFSRLTTENRVTKDGLILNTVIHNEIKFIYKFMKGLKELLDIASHNGSLRNSLLGIKSEDKEIQADVSCLIP